MEGTENNVIIFSNETCNIYEMILFMSCTCTTQRNLRVEKAGSLHIHSDILSIQEIII